ncbi:MAG: peptide ABC transporter permease [Deltaproteobacteria bacterium]|jgi:ABC-type lipoprotein release transport system permease subunit|nr:peptide ABC transporter permease [Deltaproteobacteria bacterium]
MNRKIGHKSGRNIAGGLSAWRGASVLSGNLLDLVITLAVCLLSMSIAGSGTAAASAMDQDQFFKDIKALSDVQDRSTGTPGNTTAADYIKNRLSKMGFEIIGSQRYSVPVLHHESSRLQLSDTGPSIPILPYFGNAVSPQTIPAPGIKGPLIYGGNGEPRAYNGKTVEGAIVLLELDSGRNWEYAATMGARALIYIDRGNSSNILFKDKFELSPVQFPRFWMPLDQARTLFGLFDNPAVNRVADQIILTSDTHWQGKTAENIYCLLPGRDPEFKNEMVLVEAFYDSSIHVAGVSPGADEACGVATLLEFARRIIENPPQKTVLLVASAGHAQTLSGMREFIWGLSERSKTVKQMKLALKFRIKKTRQTIDGLKRLSFQNNTFPEPGVMPLLDVAIKERLKTEADRVSRQLMQLRLETDHRADSNAIKKLAGQRQLLRRLTWRTSYESESLSTEEMQLLDRVVAEATHDNEAVLRDIQQQSVFVEDVDRLRGHTREYDLAASISLHLSSHGTGFGAFNYGWLFPFRPRINRVASYSRLDEVLRKAAEATEQELGITDFFKDTLRPSKLGSWKNFFVDQPPLGGEIAALAGYHGLSLVTTYDARAFWGTAYDTLENLDRAYASQQAAVVCGILQRLVQNEKLHEENYPRKGLATLAGSAKFLRHGELFADQPAPGTVLLVYQGPAMFYTMVDQTGAFFLKGIADSKHSFHKAILEGYKFDTQTGSIDWTIDKNLTGKNAYRVKMIRPAMETDLKMFACKGTTLFNLLEPRTFRYLTKTQVLDGRREAEPVRFFYSRLDTWVSNISTVFLEPGTPLKLTLSDSALNKKLILLNNSPQNPQGTGYRVENWSVLHRTGYRIARDMWTLLVPRITNLEESGIFNERIQQLQNDGLTALKQAENAWKDQRYDRFFEASSKSWALASRVYDDIEKTQKDVLYGVLFYIALFVPFAFCLERLLFSYTSIYKRITAFSAILVLLITVIYNVHPAFQLAYSPMVVILAFLIMGLSLVVTLIIFFRFEEEMTRIQSRSQLSHSGEIGRWKAFVAAFLLGVSNLRRRRLRTALTCITLIILTFTIMSFTSVKSIRKHTRILYNNQSPYQGFLLKNINWRDLPPQAYTVVSNAFSESGIATPRVWLEEEDRTRSTRIPIHYSGKTFEAKAMIGLSHEEVQVSGIDSILIGGRWLRAEDRQAVLLPDRMAAHLGIDLETPVDDVVTIWGTPFRVVGIFSGERLQELKDLDGEPLTPAIFPREASDGMTEAIVEALESGDDLREFQSRYQHLDAEVTVIVPFQKLMAAGGHVKGISVRLDAAGSSQETAQMLVDRFGLSLFSGEKSGTYLYHASDSMSYSGVPNIIVPILISIFIVLNTMISSVYERKREIGIYTSVGLAPSHVSFLFIAEAMAFAVLSVVFGYILAQTSAKFFAGTALWSGITVNYSSAAGIGAMILVILVVMISVLYPSKVAGEIAIPDINRSWTLPAPRENRLDIVLPFLMTYREHRSAGGFLYEYFTSHQEITHGKFSTGDIAFTFLCETPPKGEDSAGDCPEDQCAYEECLHFTSKVWLAPFDFGILQQVALKFKPAEGEKGFLEVHISLVREPGESNAWQRIKKPFLHEIRKQLLLWRSFDDETKRHYERLLTKADQAQQVA